MCGLALIYLNKSYWIQKGNHINLKWITDNHWVLMIKQSLSFRISNSIF